MAAARHEDITLGGRITVENFCRLFTPARAAKILYMSYLFDTMDPEGARYYDRVMGDDGGHQWFCYCLGIAARRLE